MFTQIPEDVILDEDLASAVINGDIDLEWAVSYQSRNRRPYLATA